MDLQVPSKVNGARRYLYFNILYLEYVQVHQYLKARTGRMRAMHVVRTCTEYKHVQVQPRIANAPSYGTFRLVKPKFKKRSPVNTTPHQGTVLYQVITTCRTCFELPHSHVRTDRTGWPFSLASTNIGRHGKRPESSSPVSKVIPV